MALLVGFAALLAGTLWWMSRNSDSTSNPLPQAAADHSASQPPERIAASNFPLTNSPTLNKTAASPDSRASFSAKETPLVSALTMGERRTPKNAASATTPASDTLAPRERAGVRGSAPKTPSNTHPSSAVQSLIQDADDALASNELLTARVVLNRALAYSRAAESQRSVIRDRLASINQELLFSPRIVDGDPLTMRYIIKPGDSLAKIAAQQKLNVDWRFIQRINHIPDPRRIRPGQTIKLVRGPFNAVISKSGFRLDLYAAIDPADSTRLADSAGSAGANADSRLFIRSFSVGLGQYSSTPTGKWIVRRNSKLINPPWTNPKTGQRFSADNPDNPIGERWIGLAGTDDNTSFLQGYGIHGTIAPDSIGEEVSMGCVRLLPDDVDILYEMLVEGVSEVEITP